jgi:predicted aspartyl protease
MPTMTAAVFDYDSTYQPPAPIVEIEIDGYHASFGSRRLWAMVDSGADATMIPLEFLNVVGATYQETLWMHSVSGVRIEVDLYLVAVRIGANLVRGVHVVAVPAGSEALIGRDVLNLLVLTLDGPAAIVSVQDGFV